MAPLTVHHWTDLEAGISMLAQIGEEAIAPGLSRLADDLSSGR
jgi:hypothetical protein